MTDILMRTPEQEVRLEELEEAWTSRRVTEGEIQERQCLLNMAPCTSPISRKIKVRVWREDSSYGTWTWQITVKVGREPRPLPSISVIRDLLPPSSKKYLPGRTRAGHSSLSYLRRALEEGLTAEHLHDALRAWATAAETASRDVSSETPAEGIDSATAELLRAQPATLEVAGKVFRLVPCRETDVRPLIARVRSKALAVAGVQATRIVDKANTDARLVVTQAEQKAATVRREIEAEKARVILHAPDWMLNTPHFYDSNRTATRTGRWWVHLTVPCYVDHIRYTVPQWNKILYWNALRPAGRNSDWYDYSERLKLWVALGEGGTYSLNSVSLQDDSPVTHIASRVCMELQGLPRVIDSMDALLALENGIGRGMRVVNLNSPLDSGVDNYWPAFKAQLPRTVIKKLKGQISFGGAVTASEFKVLNPSITWDREESIQSEADSVFTLDDPRLAAARAVREPGPAMPAIPTPDRR